MSVVRRDGGQSPLRSLRWRAILPGTRNVVARVLGTSAAASRFPRRANCRARHTGSAPQGGSSGGTGGECLPADRNFLAQPAFPSAIAAFGRRFACLGGLWHGQEEFPPAGVSLARLP
ncbi:hypothetical protein D516_0077 [Rhodobacter sp. AKP1]|nr:hypothetical protein D516_0077 [Rhodobacter sp. AKP1]